MNACARIALIGAAMGLLSSNLSGMTIPEAKMLADETNPVTLIGKVLTYAEDNFFYIEEDDRSAGIRVEKTNHGLADGLVNVSGTIYTNANSERYIAADMAERTAGAEVAPLGVKNQSLGGTDWNVVASQGQKGATDASGLNNIGLLIKLWGYYYPGDSTSFTIDDGSGVRTLCTVPSGFFLYSGWEYVVVTGISSLQTSANPALISKLLVKMIEVITPAEAISTPGTPAGETQVQTNTVTSYSTTGASCTQGHPVEYSFDWGDGTTSEWSTADSSSHSWSTAGQKIVTVAARCQAHPSLSAASGPLSVTVSEQSAPGEMVFIPAGTFMMGNTGSEGYSSPNELPQHEVYLSAYSIGKYEVTRGEYRQFIDAGGYSNSSYWSEAGWTWKPADKTEPNFWAAQQDFGSGTFTQTDNHPVVGVTYYEAEAYCDWAGGHLPTEAQWEKAARWTGISPNVYPWGDSWDVELCNNYSDNNAAGGGYLMKQTAPVGSYPLGASPYGCMDMAGNAWEWCKDWFQVDYYSVSPSTDPTGPDTGTQRLLRGGAYSSPQEHCRCSKRFPNNPTLALSSFGFRLAR